MGRASSEPLFGHVPFGGLGIGHAHFGGGEGFEIEPGESEGDWEAGECHQVPVHEHEVVRGGIADEDGFAREVFEPGPELGHGLFGVLLILGDIGPGVGLCGPPGHGVLVGHRRGEGL